MALPALLLTTLSTCHVSNVAAARTEPVKHGLAMAHKTSRCNDPATQSGLTPSMPTQAGLGVAVSWPFHKPA
jgi:hypothetical protein